jgi:hypothetical protein
MGGHRKEDCSLRPTPGKKHKTLLEKIIKAKKELGYGSNSIATI